MYVLYYRVTPLIMTAEMRIHVHIRTTAVVCHNYIAIYATTCYSSTCTCIYSVLTTAVVHHKAVCATTRLDSSHIHCTCIVFNYVPFA